MLTDVTEEMIMTDGTDPGNMAPAERLDEVSMLLSLAMLRLWRRRRRQARSAGVDERAFSRERVTIPLAVSRNDGSV